MEAEIANLNLEDEKEEPIPYKRDLHKEDEDYQLCLIGKALTDCVIHFSSLKRTLAYLWHPLGGVVILDLGDKRYLFRFFYEVDIKRVLDGMPWSFNRHLLVFHQLIKGGDPKQIPLNHTYFWIQDKKDMHIFNTSGSRYSVSYAVNWVMGKEFV
ncbi:hypothetical protein Gorai_021445, partial [Gossypium raimondii]|nr:hypothetical protein [Gossypium raimondii]